MEMVRMNPFIKQMVEQVTVKITYMKDYQRIHILLFFYHIYLFFHRKKMLFWKKKSKVIVLIIFTCFSKRKNVILESKLNIDPGPDIYLFF